MSVQFILKYHNLDLIETGDVILFKSPLNRTSLSIVLGTRSNWTHIGIAIWEIERGERRLYIFDAHASVGVRKVPFDLISRRYESVYIRKIPYERDTSQFPILINSFIDEYINKPYVSLIKVPLIPYIPFSDPGVSCGELVARWFDILGILSPSKSLVNYIPADFVTGEVDFGENMIRILYHNTRFDSPTLLFLSIGVVVVSLIFLSSSLIDIYHVNK